jgi:aerobic carbon-monoxide dehydrogenase large subunit
MGASDFAGLPHIGEALKRKEDYRFLTGAGQYTDDVTLANQAHAVFVRSPHAHAKLNSVDTSAALKMPGVVGIITGKDIEGKMGGLPCGWLINNPDGTPMKEPMHPILAINKVRYVGDHVAMVVAETVEQARNAAEAVVVDYEVLPAVVSVRDAAKKQSGVTIHDEAPDNQCYKWALGDKAAVDAAFAKAAHVTTLDLVNNRLVPNPIEPRVAIGSYSRAGEEYVLYVANQNPHVERLLMTAFVLGLPEHKVRVIAPDVGGGFGSKIFLYAEDVCLTWAAKQLNRSIKWTADRSECFLADAHGRDHVTHGEMALDQDGKFLALRVHTDANLGAYHPLRDFAGRAIHHTADLCGSGRLVHQHGAGRRVPGRGPARGDLPAGAPGHALRLGAGAGTGRDPQAQLHHHLPVPDAGGAAVRHGRFPRQHGQGPGPGRSGRFRRP